MALSKEEKGNIRHEAPKTGADIEVAGKPKNKKKIILISIISVILALVIGGIAFSYINSIRPGPLDDFAKCLTEKGAVMYGASFCKYTAGQKAMFGNSMRFINYKDFSENSDVSTTPTWFVNGQKYEKAQSFDRLAAITGCKLP